MMINAIMARVVAEMEAGEIIDPLAQSFTLAAVWADLARLAGEDVPAAVAALVGDAPAQRVGDQGRIPVRGSHYDHARQFGPDAWLPAE